MTFVVDGTNGLTFNDATTQSSTATNASNISSGTLGKARLPTGSVLQVVNATYSTEVTNSTSTYADTGLTASITPLFSTSKILVFVEQNGCNKQTNNTFINLRLLRGSTVLIIFEAVAGYTNSVTEANFGGSSASYLDSPSTTSSITYKTQLISAGNTALVGVQRNSSVSTITLMEIAA